MHSLIHTQAYLHINTVNTFVFIHASHHFLCILYGSRLNRILILFYSLFLVVGLDEDMNYGLDSYAGFEEPFPFENPTKAVSSLPDGCHSLRSLSPENPVLGDSGWDVNDGEKVDLFPSPTKKAIQSSSPALSSVPTVNPVTIPTLPAPIHVPVVIDTANVVIPLGTARFTGFTAASSQVSRHYITSRDSIIDVENECQNHITFFG
jgi:hypothetical protein